MKPRTRPSSFLAHWRTVLAGVVLVFASPAWAGDSAELIKQGNEHYAAGRFAELCKLMSRRTEADGGTRRNCCTIERRRIQAGQPGRGPGAVDASNPLGDANSRPAAITWELRLGGPRAARRAGGTGMQELLERVISQYRDAIRLDQAADARANLELVYRLKQLEEQQPQSQPSASLLRSRPASRPRSRTANPPRSPPNSRKGRTSRKGRNSSNKALNKTARQTKTRINRRPLSPRRNRQRRGNRSRSPKASPHRSRPRNLRNRSPKTCRSSRLSSKRSLRRTSRHRA